MLSISSSGRWLWIVLLIVLLNVAVLFLSIVMGEFPVPFMQSLKTVLGFGDPEYDFVVNTLRFPRALIAFLVGSGLALAGAILQGITRNPLASPGTIGLNAGAAMLAVIALVAVPAFPIGLLPFVAFGGALLAAAITYSLAWKRGLSPIRLLLVGVGVAATANAFITMMLTTNQIQYVKQAMLWMAGSVYGRSWEHFWPLLPWIMVLLPIALLLARQLDILQLGDEMARGMGSSVERIRGLLLLTSVGLAGASVATAGTVGFVGLMAPHIARQMVGSSSYKLLTVSALVGGLILMAADLVGRTIFPPLEIPCGIITAIIGAPYLIYLLHRNRNKH